MAIGLLLLLLGYMLLYGGLRNKSITSQLKAVFGAK